MADAGDALDVLARALHGDDAPQAAWDVLDLGERLADALTWQTGVDPVQAMAAAQSCREARRYLPVPATGRPAQASPLDADTVAGCAQLLGLIARMLQPPTGSRIQPSAPARQEAARHAAAAQQGLSALSEARRTTA